ncbi:MAG: hypothetical protein HOO96_38655 [Polyangiaceae bacterium]|nr:hypothetical protein [Polyangiaceae bacterium]
MWPYALLLPAGTAPSVYPETLSWTGWWRATYLQAPWNGAGSAGLSAGRYLRSASAGPSSGTAVNGYNPASFDGFTNELEGDGTIEDYVTIGSDFTSVAVLKIDPASLPADSTPAYDCPQIWSNGSANAGVAISAGGFRAWHYDDNPTTPLRVTAIASVSDWSVFHVVFSKIQGGTVQIRLDGGSWISQSTSGTLASLGGLPLEVGRNYDASGRIKGDILELGFIATPFDTTAADNYRTYALTRYALGTGIPCLVVMTDGSIRQRPTTGPYGKRIIWDGATLVCAVSTGKSLVLNPDGSWRQANVGESVLVPP